MPRINNEKFYTSAIEKHGVHAKGVNWRSKHSQRLRFQTIAEILPKDLKTYSIVDAGCGFGDFYLYLSDIKKEPISYKGIDSLYDMYKIASERTGKEIILADIIKDEIPKASFYVCSGAMNILNEFETHLFIRKCYEASEIGFVFNILYGDTKSRTYNYINDSALRDIASKLNVQNILFKKDYLEGDITVGFFK